MSIRPVFKKVFYKTPVQYYFWFISLFYMLLSHILTKKNYKTPVQETFDFGSYKLQDHRSYIKLVRKTPVLSARHYGNII